MLCRFFTNIYRTKKYRVFQQSYTPYLSPKLYQFFNYKEFREYAGEKLQEKAVKLALAGKSLLAVFPTGGGKSLTFQLPALMEGENSKAIIKHNQKSFLSFFSSHRLGAGR